jgi:acyl-coenzyme A thioesterase PaaI-like protein
MSLRNESQTMLEMGRKIIHAGRSVGLTECDVEDARGHLIARASSTCMTLRDERARGR